MRGSRAIDGPSSLKLLRPGGRAPGLVIGCAVIRPFDQLCKRLEKIVTIWRLFDKHIPQVALVALPPEIAERGKRVQRAGGDGLGHMQPGGQAERKSTGRNASD